MSDKYMQETPTTSITFWVLGQMLKGAGYAAIFCVALIVLWLALKLVSWALPEQSKQMPSPYGAVTVVQTETVA